MQLQLQLQLQPLQPAAPGSHSAAGTLPTTAAARICGGYGKWQMASATNARTPFVLPSGLKAPRMSAVSAGVMVA